MRTYDIRDLPKVNSAWVQRNLGVARAAMLSAAHRAKAMYVQRVDDARVVDTGRLKSSFVVEPTQDGALLANAAPYFLVMDEGRRPNGKLPPLEPILQWVLRKRLLQTRTGRGRTRASVNKSPKLLQQAKSLAFAIRLSIARKGIRPREITTGDVVRRRVFRFISDAVGEAMRAFGTEP